MAKTNKKMKQYKGGLVIGKFYPFHKGHEYLIQTAIDHSDTVTVVICQTDAYKIPVKIRAGWIKNTFPGVKVKVLNHDQSLDSNSTDISKTWADITVKFLGYIPDCVFSSEEYGEPYSKYMGSKHVLVDLPRQQVPISATKIRGDMDNNWSYLSNEAKGYFAKKIVVLGAESTGTTTLARELAKKLNTVWVPEYGRTYYEGKMTSDQLNNWQTNEFVHIAEIQNAMEKALAKKANKFLICDTDSFATEIWHERYVGNMSNEIKKISSKVKSNLYIVTNTDIPFIQDGTRDGEHIRQKMHERFVEVLKERKQNYIVVSGSVEKRLSESVFAISKITTSPI